MPARRGSRPAAVAGAPRTERPVPEHLIEFQRGLFPLLLREDVDGFQRYLARWEEIIGDTAALGELPRDEVKVLMARLLRRPQQYNLPPWPAELADEVEVGLWPSPSRAAGSATSTPAPAAPPADEWPSVSANGPEPPTGKSASHGYEPDASPLPTDPAPEASFTERSAAPRPAVAPGDRSQGGPAAPPTETHPSSPTASYQVDMLTGELVPIATRSASEPVLADHGSAPTRRRPRRRRLPENLVQLELWSV